MIRNRRAGLVAAVAACCLVTSCVGPATTAAAYRGKAVHAADAALSEVQTVVLTTSGLLRGRILQAYAETVISASEEAITSVQGTFDSIQPPDNTSSDALRKALDTLLTSGSSDVSDLRIAARRQNSKDLATLAAQLKKDASKLQAFSQEHGG
jgi:ABC-type glycerol-3-phosphate transport system substrate-binding protein